MLSRASSVDEHAKRGARPQSTSHASGRVEIAANNGHNRASLAAIPIMTLTFEDFPPGHFGRFGPRRVTREEMLAFAAVADELERCRELLFDHKSQGAPIHAA